MEKTKAFQTALEQLRQQNDIATLTSSPPSTPSPPPIAKVPSKRPKCNIPDDLELENVYNPKYTVIQLISTRTRPRKQLIPPRPPNSFFLFKNCYMLELRKLGYRYCMPDVCRQSKQIWSNIPSDVKERYDILALQAQILHQEMYPEYKFSPKKRQIFKSHVFPPETTVVDTSMLNVFSVTNFLGNVTNDSDSTAGNFANLNHSKASQLLSPPSTPSTTPITSPFESINSELVIPQPNFIDYNYNFLYLNNYYLNSLNNVLIQGSPVASPEVNNIYSKIINPLNPLEFFSCPNTFNQV